MPLHKFRVSTVHEGTVVIEADQVEMIGGSAVFKVGGDFKAIAHNVTLVTVDGEKGAGNCVQVARGVAPAGVDKCKPEACWPSISGDLALIVSGLGLGYLLRDIPGFLAFWVGV